jgi:antitoxin (DNA-binding transcriptional repressor) of toxin-antitoxin stability system
MLDSHSQTWEHGRNGAKDENRMTIVTTSEAISMLPQLIASLAQGEEVLITNDGLAVAQLVRPRVQQPISAMPPIQPATLNADADDGDDRPWRGVFAIEQPGDPYPCGKLNLAAEPQTSVQEPADILWDRVTNRDD